MRISDLSSDVCSSDLLLQFNKFLLVLHAWNQVLRHCLRISIALHLGRGVVGLGLGLRGALVQQLRLQFGLLGSDPRLGRGDQIGRASCRERVCPYVSISVVAVSLKQKTLKTVLYIHNN